MFSAVSAVRQVRFSAEPPKLDKAYFLDLIKKAIPAELPVAPNPGDWLKIRNTHNEVEVSPAFPPVGASLKYVYKPDGSVSKVSQVVYPGAEPKTTQMLPPGSISPEDIQAF